MMVGKRVSVVLVVAAAVGWLLVMGCGGKKAVRGPAEEAIMPSESVTSDYVTEESVQEPLGIEEKDLEAQALRNLQAGAEQQGALEDIFFAFNLYTLGPESQEKLQRTAQWLRENPRVLLRIEGHCDERGSQEYNLALGERRAVSVEKYLRSLGVDAERMETISYGEERPVDPASTEAAWAKNRRAHFAVTGR